MTLNDRLGAIYRSTDDGGGGYETGAPDSFDDYSQDDSDGSDRGGLNDGGRDYQDEGNASGYRQAEAWLDAYAQDLTREIAELSQQVNQPADHPWSEDDAYRSIDERMAQHTSAGMRMMGEMMRPVLESQMVHHVAGDLEPDAQEYIRSELRGMDPVAMANLSRNPAAMRILKYAAQGFNRQGPHTEAPVSEGIYSNSPNLDAAAEKEIAAYMRAFGRYGATRKMAVAAYRRATGGR